MVDVNGLANSIFSGDRVALGKAITLIESNHPEHRSEANLLLQKILPKSGNSLRIGITGVPGVGKSTFIEALGELIITVGKKVAVLAIDPSSPQSKGSILGDKTRMEKLAANPGAFIRPSASGGHLGGVANKTLEAILLCEAAGYDLVLVETVGVGQSEIAVKNMTDVFLLMMLAGAGDELQGIKRGIMEMADILVINKADGDNLKAAKMARKTYDNALHLLAAKESGWTTPVLTASSLNGDGVSEVLDEIYRLNDFLLDKNLFQANRTKQKKHWFTEILGSELLHRIKSDTRFGEKLDKLEEDVLADSITPYQASIEILDQLFARHS
jgi:LAO/AO transport system kinase